MGLDRLNIDDYKPNSIQQWCAFQSTSQDIKIAYEFSYNGTTNGGENPQLYKEELLVFKIFINKNNKVASNILLSEGSTEYAYEKEVLLLPFFTFRVIDITQTEEKRVQLQPSEDEVRARVTIVTVMEIPF